MKQPDRQPVTLSQNGVIVETGGGKLPRVRPIKLTTLTEIRTELSRVYREARCGHIDPADATRFAFLLGELKSMCIAMELEQRLQQLERAVK